MLIFAWLTTLTACVCVAHAAGSTDDNACVAGNVSTVQFSVKSRVNQTGHWIYQVDSLHEKKAGQRPWTIAVEQSQVECQGVEFLRTVTTITAPAAKAGPGYEYRAGVGYYKLHVDKKTWLEAKETCESEGAHLAVVNSETELRVLVNMMARYPDIGPWAFLGFHDLYDEGNYLTLFDEPLGSTGYTRWCPGQPDNAGGKENCGSLHRNSCGLNDYPCHASTPFFCEQQL